MGDLQNGCRQVQKGIGAGMVRAGIVVNKVAESGESEYRRWVSELLLAAT